MTDETMVIDEELEEDTPVEDIPSVPENEDDVEDEKPVRESELPADAL